MQSHDNATRMEERSEEYCDVKKKFPPDQKRSTSGVMYAAFGEKIKNCLKNPELYSIRSFDTICQEEEIPGI